jgi:hypothetical protein
MVRVAPNPLPAALKILNAHYLSFIEAKAFAQEYDQLIPTDTKAWSQILISALAGMKGLARKKGADFADGSDVKAANCWSAIDTPRFNGSLPAGRISATSKKADDVSALDEIPYLFFVLWDDKPDNNAPRCRVWCVRPGKDVIFRGMAAKWYQQRKDGKITSNNFQLHPPRFKNSDIFRNECGNLSYPLLFSALWDNDEKTFKAESYNPNALVDGKCAVAQE